MNFFEAQDRARKNTKWCILLFLLAVVVLVLLTSLLLLVILNLYLLNSYQTDQMIFSLDALKNHYSWQDIAQVPAGICLLIFGVSFYKTRSLSKGGSTVAEMLGGQRVSAATTDLQQRQLLNVVEEMAIAAGMPIPRVYLLEDMTINAFAAGNSPANAVIGVTRGTMTHLNREELQGVIAHEFSHIANGDMRLNIRLIGVLHGILLLGLIGGFLLRLSVILKSSNSKGDDVAIFKSSNSKGDGAAAAIFIVLVLLGFGLLVIGYAGSFFGNWIKSIVSRQREYLADSSAVQFTRNKHGIAGALKKIGGSGSFLESPTAAQYSHAFFAEGVDFFLRSLFSTHPPLEKRIRRIEPRWDGKFIATPEPETALSSAAEQIAAALTSGKAEQIAAALTSGKDTIDAINEKLVAARTSVKAEQMEQMAAALTSVTDAIDAINGEKLVAALTSSIDMIDAINEKLAAGLTSGKAEQIAAAVTSGKDAIKDAIDAINEKLAAARTSGKLEQIAAALTSAKDAIDAINEKLAAALTSLTAEYAISQIGTLNEQNIEYVRELIITMPLVLRDAAQDAYTARALIYAILIGLQKGSAAAISALQQYTDPDLYKLCKQLLPELKNLQEKFKLPLLELSINALRDLSPNQFVQFKQAVHHIIVSDKTVNLNEWVIHRLVIQQLDEHFGFRKPPRGKYKNLKPTKSDVETMLSLIAHVEHADDSEAQAAFSSGAFETGLESLNMLARNKIKLGSLNHALDALARLKPLAKPRLLKACVAITLQDGKATTRGIELVRTISICLDCPMPPIPVVLNHY